MAQHPDGRVQFDSEGSSTLVQQIQRSRQADVFASADTQNMDKVVLAESPPWVFTTNRLTIVTPPGRAGGIHSLTDLVTPGRKVVVCAPQVPCGSATKKVEQASGTQLHPVSEENDVESVLRKVAAGEADAGLVYVSDAHSSVETIDFPESQRPINTYPQVTLKNAPKPQLAADWKALLQSPAGRDVLTRHGFGLRNRSSVGARKYVWSSPNHRVVYPLETRSTDSVITCVLHCTIEPRQIEIFERFARE